VFPGRLVSGEEPYKTSLVSFKSGDLKIVGLLGRPPGDGQFPAYISNHGSMTLQAASAGPWSSITVGSLTDVLARHGYVVLIVARRGYRGSEGTTTTYSTNATSPAYGKRAVDVMRGAEAEVDDVLAALEYLNTVPYVDRERIAVGGVSLGGLVSVMAAARDTRFKALVSMAGGYRQTEARRPGADEAWPYVEEVWRKSAARIQAPTLILWSRNDSTIEVDVGRELERQLRKAGKPVEMKIYPSFGDNGHAMFSDPKGVPAFALDVVRFLDTAQAR
jgi:dienelactone hydrolase